MAFNNLAVLESSVFEQFHLVPTYIGKTVQKLSVVFSGNLPSTT